MSEFLKYLMIFVFILVGLFVFSLFISKIKSSRKVIEEQNKSELFLVSSISDKKKYNTIEEYIYENKIDEIIATSYSTPSNLEDEFNMGYYEYLKYLLDKHGDVKFNYFKNESWLTKSDKMRRVNDGLILTKHPQIERLNDGLFLHHMGEDCAVSYEKLIENDYARSKPYELYTADNFVYCDYLEHLMLHLKISIEDVKISNGEPVGVDLFGARKIWKELNRFYTTGKTLDGVQQCAEMVRSEYKKYIEILKLVLQHPVLSKMCDAEELSHNPNGMVESQILSDLLERSF